MKMLQCSSGTDPFHRELWQLFRHGFCYISIDMMLLRNRGLWDDMKPAVRSDGAL